MTTKDQTDLVLQKAAMLSFVYYPEIHIDEPSYSLLDEAAWCLTDLSDVPPTQLEDLKVLIGRAIADPTAHRVDVFAALLELVDGGVD